MAPSYERGMLTNGTLVRELEERMAERLAVAETVAVSSCTAGLMLVLRHLAPAGTWVLLPSFTFSASAHAPAWCGLTPVFTECRTDTFQVDVADLEARLAGAGNAGALVATHVFGAPCDVEGLEAVARSAGLPLVFDAAHALGGRRRDRLVGGFGDVEVFSLSPTKLVVGGEGGIVATNREDVAEAVRLGRDYGNPGDYDCRFPGLNARMSEFHAAVALESLALLDEHLERRQALARHYRDLLAGVEGVAVQVVDDADMSTYKDFTTRIDDDFGVGRDEVVAALAAEGIDTRCYFHPPVHAQQAYAHLPRAVLPVTDDLSRRVISLPMFARLTPDDVMTVVEVLASLGHQADQVSARLSA